MDDAAWIVYAKELLAIHQPRNLERISVAFMLPFDIVG
jgi:hypothetical protein